MSSLQQSYKKSLVYRSQYNPDSKKKPLFLHSKKKINRISFWSDRIVLAECESTDELWNFTALDLLTNESRQIRFPKIDKDNDKVHIFSLNDKLGFIDEWSVERSYVSFVELDWLAGEFRVIEKFKQKSQLSLVCINKLESGKFVLLSILDNDMWNYQIGTLKRGKIEIGKIYESNEVFTFYSKDLLIGFDSGESYIATYNLNTEKEEIFNIDVLVGSFHLNYISDWINDRLYTTVRSENTNIYGIMWTDLKTKKWTSLDFETDLNIRELKFHNGNLIVCGEKKELVSGKNYNTDVKIYSIPMRRPNFLRKSAWLLTVKVMKQNGEIDPYKAAKEFLPLNSNLQSPWFEDKEQT